MRDQVSACGLEMISLFALLYFLKTLLHFDVFGQSLQQVAQREEQAQKHNVKHQQAEEAEKVKEEVEEVEEEAEEDEDYNEDTVERSYSVSSWSWPGSVHSDNDEDEEADITSVRGDSRCEEEEIIDEIPADHEGAADTQISSDQDDRRDEIECESDSSDLISDCEAIYSTDWYTDHYKHIIKQKSASLRANEAER